LRDRSESNGGSSLKVQLDFSCIRIKGSGNFLVEIPIPFVDVINVCFFMEDSPTTELVSLGNRLVQFVNHLVEILTRRRLHTSGVVEVVCVTIEIWLSCFCSFIFAIDFVVTIVAVVVAVVVIVVAVVVVVVVVAVVVVGRSHDILLDSLLDC